VEPRREDVLRALERVIDPELGRPVTELDMVRDVRVEGTDVAVTIALTVAGCPLRSSFENQVRETVGALPGVAKVSLTFDVMSPEERQALTAKLRGSVTERTKGISLDASTRVLAVASGKGGVGKSTLTANLAAAFARLGQRTGILDADVYGHSIPHLLGIRQKPVLVDKMIVPPVRHFPQLSSPAHRPVVSDGLEGEPASPESGTASGAAVGGDVGLKLMSIGFFLDGNEPVMWRGPMLHRALEQFLSDVHWGELDTLLVDMPPGTGDVAISLGQLLPRAEALVVTTPQPLAQEVAARAALMARKTHMRLIGVVENMSGEVFGSGGGAALAADLDVPLLGRVPLDGRLREQGDAGEPLVAADPDTPAARALLELAERVAATRRDQGVGIVKKLPVVA
jgi:ATP-binding protein involved in chromosome partitioning